MVTGLIWQRGTGPATYTQIQARDYCAALTLASCADWRLPTLVELESIVDTGHSVPAVNPNAFPSTTPGEYWTSTPVALNAGNVWSVSLSSGGTRPAGTSDLLRVRCVR
jgi:hypothetical protein